MLAGNLDFPRGMTVLSLFCPTICNMTSMSFVARCCDDTDPEILINSLPFYYSPVVCAYNIFLFLQGVLKCEDTACGAETRKLPSLFDNRGRPMCQACEKSAMHPQVLTILSYLYIV